MSEETATKNRSKKFKKTVNILFLCFIIFGIASIVFDNLDRIHEYKDTLLSINYWHLLIVLAITMAATILRSLRWYYLLIPVKKNISWINVLRVNMNALAANYSTPGKAGVPVKAFLLKKTENIDYSYSLPSILFELFLEYSLQLILLIICVFVGGHLSKLFFSIENLITNLGFIQNFIFLILTALIVCLIIYLLKSKINLKGFFVKFQNAVKITRKRWDCLIYSGLISTFNLIMSFFGFWLLIVALGHPEITLTFVIFSSGLTNIVGAVSPLPGGLGVREITIYGLYDIYFGLGGVAFLAIILMRLITYLALLILFISEKIISTSIKKLNPGFSD